MRIVSLVPSLTKTLAEGKAISEKVALEAGQHIWSVCIDGEALTWSGTHTLHGLKVLGLFARI